MPAPFGELMPSRLVASKFQRLQQAGFRDLRITPVPHADNLRWNADWTLLQARAV